MTWLVRSSRLYLVPIAAVLSIGVVAVVPGGALPFPNLSGGGVFIALPLASLLAIGCCLVLAYCASRIYAGVTIVSSRPIRVAALGLGSALLALLWGGAGLAAVARQSWTDQELLLARSALGFIGLQFASIRMVGYRNSAFVPVVYLFLAALFGRAGATDAAAVWAWPLSEQLSTASTLVIAGLSGAAVASEVCTMLAGPSRLMRRHELELGT